MCIRDRIRLGDKVFFCDHGDELVKQLKATVKQYAVTNGTTVAQERKLRFSGDVYKRQHSTASLDSLLLSRQMKKEKEFL